MSKRYEFKKKVAGDKGAKGKAARKKGQSPPPRKGK